MQRGPSWTGRHTRRVSGFQHCVPLISQRLIKQQGLQPIITLATRRFGHHLDIFDGREGLSVRLEEPPLTGEKFGQLLHLGTAQRRIEAR